MRLTTALALFLALSVPLRAETALVAVATNFRPVAERLASDFTAATGQVVTFSAAATAKLAAQIEAGAPYDVFLSADAETPARLVVSGFAVEGSRFTYAVGRLVLWSTDPDLDLSDPGAALAAARHVAIANPALAPYGKAALQTIDFMGISEPELKIVMGENVGQAQALVASGAAELGFVAASGVPEGSGASWPVPEDYHAPIRQDAVLLVHGRDNPAAVAFLAYLRADGAREVIGESGYGFAP